MEKEGLFTIIDPLGVPVCEVSSGFICVADTADESRFKDPVTFVCSINPGQEVLEKLKSFSQFYDILKARVSDFLVFCLRNRIEPPLRGNISRAKLKKRDIKGIICCKADIGYTLCGLLQGENVIMKDGHIVRYDSLDNKIYGLIKIKY